MNGPHDVPTFGLDRADDPGPTPASHLEDTTRRRPNHSLLNWRNCRQYALDYAKQVRPATNFDRISKDQVQPFLEGVVRKALERLVHTQPSGVRTIKIETSKRRRST